MTQLTEDMDLRTFVELFDTAMTSTNPTVKKCFHNLLMLAALVHAEETDDHKKGPLGKLIDEVDQLHKKVEALRIQVSFQHPAYHDNMHKSTTGAYGSSIGAYGIAPTAISTLGAYGTTVPSPTTINVC
jgi:hypothetical protein